MQKLIVISLLGVLAAGISISYLMYRQLGTGTVSLRGEPELVAAPGGQQCGDIGFSVKARALGQWLYNVPKGKTISGTVTVSGGESQDIGFSISSPVNRVVFSETEYAHERAFEVVGTVRGDYRFDFDNRHSSFTEKDVTVTLCLA